MEPQLPPMVPTPVRRRIGQKGWFPARPIRKGHLAYLRIENLLAGVQS